MSLTEYVTIGDNAFCYGKDNSGNMITTCDKLKEVTNPKSFTKIFLMIIVISVIVILLVRKL